MHATEQTGSYDPFDNLPEELKAHPQWVAWRYEDHGKPKRDKVPYDPRIGQRAKSNDSQTWATFAEAVAAFHRGGFAGLGFVFSEADSYTGVDLDGCRDPETGRLEPWAGDLVERLNSYTEASPSGTGVHIFVRATLPAGGRKKGKIEMYSEGRFFTVTGEHRGGTPTTIEERAAELAALHAEVFGKSQENSQKQAHTGNGAADGHTNPLPDEELILRAQRAKNGELFTRLWSGDTTGYPSQSEADQALSNLLAFWCGNAPAQIDRLFRQSGLYRKKWDEKRFSDGRTYGEATIEEALAGAREFYSGGGSSGTQKQSSQHEGAPATDSSNTEDESLRAAVRQTILDPDMKSFDKKRAAADLIRQSLIEWGDFYRTSDGRLFFFSHGERRLYDIEQQPFARFLVDKSGLSTTETFFNFALDILTAHVARKGKLAEVHTLSHYDVRTKMLTVSDGGGGVWRREHEGEWEEGKNGDGGILFLTEPEAIRWMPESNGGEHLAWFLDQINFCPAPLSIDDQRAFFTVWLLQQFFPSLRRTRTIPAWLGPQGSGKSTTCRLIGRFLLGEEFDVSGIRKEKEDAFIAAITNRVIHGIDNADTRVDWLEDALARYATGEVFRLRRLYTTNEEVSYRPRAILMLTSRDPHFQRSDVSQRLLPFQLQEIEEFQDEPTIFAELARRRNPLWGELLAELAEVQDALQEGTGPKLPFRMADYATFGWQVFQAQERGDEWIAALRRLDAAQMSFAAEGDGMVMALGIFMEGQEQIGPLSVHELYAKLAEVTDANSLEDDMDILSVGDRVTYVYQPASATTPSILYSRKAILQAEANGTLTPEVQTALAALRAHYQFPGPVSRPFTRWSPIAALTLGAAVAPWIIFFTIRWIVRGFKAQ